MTEKNPDSSSQPQTPRPLTPKEKKVLEYIEEYMAQQGFSPSYKEIKEFFGFASFNSVQRYLKQLQRKGYVHLPGGNQKRAISLVNHSQAIQSFMDSHSHSSRAYNSQAPPASLPRVEPLALPLLGRVAAGTPIEALEHDEFIDVPASLVRNPQNTFALKVEGSSMIEDGIFDGDIVLVQNQNHASSGQTVVAVVENEATVKRFFSYQQKPSSKDINRNSPSYTHLRSTPWIELRPANSSMDSLWYPQSEVEIRGVVVGLIRKF